VEGSGCSLFKVPDEHFLEGLMENTKTSVRTADVPAQIARRDFTLNVRSKGRRYFKTPF
jgi:hypothetical protein